MQNALFEMKKGEATEQETPDGFVVAVLTDIQEPDPQQNPVGFAQLRDRVRQETANRCGVSCSPMPCARAPRRRSIEPPSTRSPNEASSLMAQ